MERPGTVGQKETGPLTEGLILALETSTHSGGAAVLRDESGNLSLIGSVSFTTKQLYSQRLLPSVDWLLDRTNIAVANLDIIGISVGPGSFTGLRIGLSVAKALAYASNSKIIGVSTLEALAVRASGAGDAIVCPMLDARQGQVYAGLFQVEWSRGMPQVKILRNEWAGPITEIADWITEPTLFAGDALALARSEIAPALGTRFLEPPAHHRLPHPEDVAMLTASRAAAGLFHDPITLEPHYVRQTYTQRNKQ